MDKLSNIQVALVEDNPADARLIREMFNDISEFQVEVTHFEQLSSFIDRDPNPAFDVILLDLSLPDSQGEDTVLQVIEREKLIPVIVLTGLSDQTFADQTIEWGADDYLQKRHVDPVLLSHIIRYSIERKKVNNQLTLSLGVVNLLNHGHSIDESIRKALKMIHESTQIDAVGIRLKSGDDYPYFCYEGFSERFIQRENSLLKMDKSGIPVCNAKEGGHLACMCGYIIEGRANPENTCFTPGGSFWTNSTSACIQSEALSQLNLQTRNVCHAEGYESVAIIPIRYDHSIIGTIQLNHRTPNRFTHTQIQTFEAIGANIGMAIQRTETERLLSRSEDQMKFILENTQAGILLVHEKSHEILYANSLSLKMMGRQLSEVIGMPCHDFVSSREKGKCPMEIEGRQVDQEECMLLAADGGAIPILKSAKRFLYNEQAVYLETFIDITERKHAQEDLVQQVEELLRWQTVTLNREERIQQLKREVNTLLEDTGRPIRYPSQRKTRNGKK